MSGGDEFLAGLLRALGELFEPLERAAAGGDALRNLAGSVGWRLEPGTASAPARITEIAASVADLAAQAEGLASSDDATASAAQSKALDDVFAIAVALGQLAGSSGGLGTDLAAMFADQRLPEKLLALLVYEYLAAHQPQVFALSRLVGLIDERGTPKPGASEFAVDYLERRIDLSRMATAVTNPAKLPAEVYGWGTPDYQAGPLLRVIEVVGRAFGLAVSDDIDAGLDLYWDEDTVRNGRQRSLVLPVWSGIGSGTGLSHGQLDLVVVPLPGASAELEGIAVFPRFQGAVSASATLLEGVTLTVSGRIEDEGAVRAELRPSGASLVVAAGVADIEDVSVSIGLAVQPPKPFVLIGSATSSRLEIAQAHAELGVGLHLGEPRMHLDLGLDRASIVIDLGKGDGFLQKLLGGEPQQLDVGFGVLWSTQDGLRFNGTATVRLELPVHLDLAGVVHIDTIHLVLGAVASPQPGAQLEVSVTGGLALGPFAAQVDRLGVTMNLVGSPDHTGSLGDLDLQFGFKPPNGLGFVVDADPVTGGGYVSFDWEKGEYAGILDLEVAGKFAIKAIGILATKMPDGRPGFSMLLIITAEFSPIQLGYGFTLNGVGGAIGINRTMDQAFLSNGIHTGALESLLFPPNPVAHATEIISNLKQGFPIAEGRFIFGPMVKLGWASIITVEAGILVELPMPVRLALLGRLACILPEGKDAVLLLQIDLAGFVDFGTGDIAVDATLNDSRVVTFPITGDFSIRANVGSRPDFALAAGGFHPRFTPPPGFPQLKRLGISVSTSESLRLTLGSYFAVTTNTVQAGARADFHASADLGMLGNFSADADLGFDALFHFSPFSFEVDIYGSAAVKRNGDDLASADLEFVLSGVTPWRVRGHATVHFMGDHDLPFDRTFGSPAVPAAIPATDVAALVRAAVGKADAWGAQPPGDSNALVTLRDIGATAGLLLHPLARLTVHERVAPLATQLATYGNGPIDGARVITIDDVAVTGVTTLGVDGLTDGFAPAQFFELTDDQKLTRPSFEQLPAGTVVVTSAFATATGQGSDQHYVTITVDDPDLRPADDRHDPLGGAYRASALLRESMAEVARAGTGRAAATGRYAPADQGIVVREPAWTVAGKGDLAPGGTYPSFTTAAAALAAGPGAGDRRVVGAHEVAGT